MIAPRGVANELEGRSQEFRWLRAVLRAECVLEWDTKAGISASS